jgi:hypothetical protein
MVEPGAPSGIRKRLKPVSGFTVTAKQSTNIVIDCDLRKALFDLQGQPGMRLRTALRVTNVAGFGTLAGTVAESLVTDESCSNDLVEAYCVAEYEWRIWLRDKLSLRRRLYDCVYLSGE